MCHTQTHVLRGALRVRLSAHSADGLGLVLQAEQQRPAKDEVRLLAKSVCPVLAPQYVGIGPSTH
jgi:hypothetical protein